MTPTRPVLRYHGGKWRLAPWVISHFPTHRVYVEPFGGAASVLMRKKRSYAEIYNDLDGEVVNVFRVLRDKSAAEYLCHLLRLTPFSYDEFMSAYEPSDDSIEQARRTMVKAYMGFGSAAVTGTTGTSARTGFRANSNRSGTTPSHDWRNFPEQIMAFTARLQGVTIENRDAIKIMEQHDRADTLHYLDPPYVWSTRRMGSDNWQPSYRHEMADADHEKLLDAILRLKGMVVLSAYPTHMYKDRLKGWTMVSRNASADSCLSANPNRVECLWLSPSTVAHTQQILVEVSA